MKIAGKRVLDAKTELQVTITPSDVKAGAKKNSNACAGRIVKWSTTASARLASLRCLSSNAQRND